MRYNKLIAVVILLMLTSISISLFSIYIIYNNRDELLQSLQRNVRSELARYNIPTSEDIKIDDARILLAIAKYCEAHNQCRGDDGQPGVQGIMGDMGLVGADGKDGRSGRDGANGYTPIKGVDYFDGEKGDIGEPARQLVQRCNPEKNRVEWQYQGDESWNTLYDLAPLQSCTMEEE